MKSALCVYVYTYIRAYIYIYIYDMAHFIYNVVYMDRLKVKILKKKLKFCLKVTSSRVFHPLC